MFFLSSCSFIGYLIFFQHNGNWCAHNEFYSWRIACTCTQLQIFHLYSIFIVIFSEKNSFREWVSIYPTILRCAIIRRHQLTWCRKDFCLLKMESLMCLQPKSGAWCVIILENLWFLILFCFFLRGVGAWVGARKKKRLKADFPS